MASPEARRVRVAVERAVADALAAACHPRGGSSPSVGVMAVAFPIWMTDAVAAEAVGGVTAEPIDVDALVVDLFRREASSLVRLARLFVDDRNAAEDLVQEAFIRLARGGHRIREPGKAPAYLRSIVLNLARDHNRRGLVSLRHHLPHDDQAAVEDEIDARAPTSSVSSTRCASSRIANATAWCCATTTTSGSTTSPRRSASPAIR